jgi:hypothetical protein
VSARAVWDPEWGRALEQDHDAYLERLEEGLDELDATGFPFCGCGDCHRRASWGFLIVRVLEGNRDGLVELEAPGASLRVVDGKGEDG